MVFSALARYELLTDGDGDGDLNDGDEDDGDGEGAKMSHIDYKTAYSMTYVMEGYDLSRKPISLY